MTPQKIFITAFSMCPKNSSNWSMSFLYTVVLAMDFRPDDSVYVEIARDYKTIKAGDCVSARKVFNAVHEAYDAVREV